MEYVTLAVTTSEAEAAVISGLLRARGIPYRLVSTSVGDMMLGVFGIGTGGREVRVPPNRFTEAEACLTACGS